CDATSKHPLRSPKKPSTVTIIMLNKKSTLEKTYGSPAKGPSAPETAIWVCFQAAWDSAAISSAVKATWTLIVPAPTVPAVNSAAALLANDLLLMTCANKQTASNAARMLEC